MKLFWRKKMIEKELYKELLEKLGKNEITARDAVYELEIYHTKRTARLVEVALKENTLTVENKEVEPSKGSSGDDFDVELENELNSIANDPELKS